MTQTIILYDDEVHKMRDFVPDPIPTHICFKGIAFSALTVQNDIVTPLSRCLILEAGMVELLVYDDHFMRIERFYVQNREDYVTVEFKQTNEATQTISKGEPLYAYYITKLNEECTNIDHSWI